MSRSDDKPKAKPELRGKAMFAELVGPDPEAKRVAEAVRKTGNTSPLLRYLRRCADRDCTFLGPEAVTLIADVLDGTVRATPKSEMYAIPDLRKLLAVHCEMLGEGDADVIELAHKLGYSDDDLADGRKRKTIARHLFASWLRLSLSAFADRLNPRAGRGKRG